MLSENEHVMALSINDLRLRPASTTGGQLSAELCECLQEVAMTWMQQQQACAQGPACTFRLGFHSVPSMRQLHMHVISQVCGDSPACHLLDCCFAELNSCQIARSYFNDIAAILMMSQASLSVIPFHVPS